MSGYKVTEKAMRPGGMGQRRCFYCRSPVGGVHGPRCVLVVKRVRVRLEAPRLGVTHSYEVVVPSHWDAYQIEFHRNDGSWCADNALHEVPPDVAEALRPGWSSDADDDDTPACLCNDVTFTYEGDSEPPWLQESGDG